MPIAKKPILYGLLYIAENEDRHVNLKGEDDPLSVYIKCASLCAASIRYHGYEFRLVTNNRSAIDQRLPSLNIPEFETIELPFSLAVPRGINFYSAHFKLELYSILGRGNLGDQVGVIDLDCVMMKPLDLSFLTAEVLLGYDIMDQVQPKFTAERIRSDLALIGGTLDKKVRWWGGEFLVGSAKSFQALSRAILTVWPNYLEHFENLHHLGDEMVVAAASSMLPEASMVDGGAHACASRWWTARTAHRQSSFAAARNCSILHLPSDKPFLADYAKTKFHPIAFASAFEKAVAGKLLRRRTVNLAQSLLSGPPRHVARLR